MVEILIDCKQCVRHLNRMKVEIFLVGQAVLQMNQISRLCVITSIYELLNVFEDPAQCVHTF